MSIKKENQSISDSEWQVMRVVWNKQQTTAKEIYEAIHEPLDWKMSTVKTLLGRLVTKEWLHTKKEGKRFIYTPTLEQEQAMQLVSKTFLERVCAQQVGHTLANMIDQSRLSAADIEGLQHLLMKKEATEVIECTCLPGQCNCKHKEA